MRYFLHPGLVRSKTDGEVHYVGAEQLARLYGVPPAACIEISPDGPDISGYLISDTDKHLYPREDGNYVRE